MAKLTLNTVSSGYTTATSINTNSDLVEAAFENTLSRDGTAPNYMNAALDMNGYPIQNVGRAVNNGDAISYAQFLEISSSSENLTGVIPITWEHISIGTSTYTLPLLATDAVNMFIVSVDGLIYSPSTYVVNPTTQTITFLTDIPTVGQEIVIRLFGKTPEATTDSITIDGLRASSVQTVIGAETIFSTTFNLDGLSTDVYLNGVKLVYLVDYTVATNSITLTASATAGDTLEIVSHSVVLATSANLLAAQQAAIDAEAAAALAAQSVLDSASAGALAGAVAGSEGIAWSIQTANYTTEHAEGIFADTTSGSFTITLPPSPTLGQYVHVVDVASKFSTNGITVARNGEYIMGLDEDLTVITRNIAIKFVYSGAAYGWRII